MEWEERQVGDGGGNERRLLRRNNIRRRPRPPETRTATTIHDASSSNNYNPNNNNNNNNNNDEIIFLLPLPILSAPTQQSLQVKQQQQQQQPMMEQYDHQFLLPLPPPPPPLFHDDGHDDSNNNYNYNNGKNINNRNNNDDQNYNDYQNNQNNKDDSNNQNEQYYDNSQNETMVPTSSYTNNIIFQNTTSDENSTDQGVSTTTTSSSSSSGTVYWFLSFPLSFFSRVSSPTQLLLDYVVFLNFCLLIWVLYLFIPKRLIRKFCLCCCCGCTDMGITKRRYKKPSPTALQVSRNMMLLSNQYKQQQMKSNNQQSKIQQHQQQQQQSTLHEPIPSQDTFQYSSDAQNHTTSGSYTNNIHYTNTNESSVATGDSMYMSAAESSEAGYFVNVSLPNYYGNKKKNDDYVMDADDADNDDDDQMNQGRDIYYDIEDSYLYDFNRKKKGRRPYQTYNKKVAGTETINDRTISELHDSVLQSTERVRRRRQQRQAEQEETLRKSRSISPHPRRWKYEAGMKNSNDEEKVNPSSSPGNRIVATTNDQREGRSKLPISPKHRRSSSESPSRSELMRTALVSQFKKEATEHNQQKQLWQPKIATKRDLSPVQFQVEYNDMIRIDDPYYTPPRQKLHNPNETDYQGRPLVDTNLEGQDRTVEKSDVDTKNKNESNELDNRKNRKDEEDHLDFLIHRSQQRTSDLYVSPPSSSNVTSSTAYTNAIPSPSHPSSSHRVPANHIVLETMKRLQSRGVRLLAHGIHVVEPKRVWVKYNVKEQAIEWQSESPKQIASGVETETSIILVRGALHTIPVQSILYIDVGQKTMAFLKPKGLITSQPSATCCFSILTSNGSLDLQTNSRLERDAIISCLCWLMDYVQGNDSWRRLYEESSIGDSAATDKADDINLPDSATPMQQQHLYTSLSGSLLQQLSSPEPERDMTPPRGGEITSLPSTSLSPTSTSLLARRSELLSSPYDSPPPTNQSGTYIPLSAREI